MSTDSSLRSCSDKENGCADGEVCVLDDSSERKSAVIFCIVPDAKDKKPAKLRVQSFTTDRDFANHRVKPKRRAHSLTPEDFVALKPKQRSHSLTPEDEGHPETTFGTVHWKLAGSSDQAVPLYVYAYSTINNHVGGPIVKGWGSAVTGDYDMWTIAFHTTSDLLKDPDGSVMDFFRALVSEERVQRGGSGFSSALENRLIDPEDSANINLAMQGSSDPLCAAFLHPSGSSWLLNFFMNLPCFIFLLLPLRPTHITCCRGFQRGFHPASP